MLRHKWLALEASMAFVACVLLSGCSQSPGVEFEGVTFGPDQAGKELSYGVNVFSLNKRPFLAIFNQGGLSISRATPGGFEGKMVIDDIRVAMDERSIAYSCTTNDGIDGSVQIAGQAFDLRNGNVFLVSAKLKPAEVKQIAVDLTNLRYPIADRDLEQLRPLKFIDPRVSAAIDAWQQ